MAKPSLSEVSVKKIAASAGAPRRGEAAAGESAPPRDPHYRPGRAVRTHLTVFFPKPVKKQLREIALEHDTTLQALMTEAINDLFAKYRRPEIATVNDRPKM